MPGHVPKLKIAARSLARRQEALELVGQGLPIIEVAQRMQISVQSVRNHLHKALESASLYPSSLNPEEVAQLRQVQAEVLSNSRQKALSVQVEIADRVGTDREKAGDGVASARLLEAVVRAVDLEAALFGTKQPLKVIEAQLRYQELKVDGRIKVEFDREQLRPKWRPLEITDTEEEHHNGSGASLTNGNGLVADGSGNTLPGDRSEGGAPATND